jgi:hypothetical protein
MEFSDEYSEGDEIMYEIEMSDDSDEEEEEEETEGMVYEIETPDEDEEEEEYNESLEESKKTFKAKGKNMGKPKFSYNKNPNQGEGFKVVKKNVNKTMGTGNAKKVNVYKDKETLEGEFKIKPKGVKKAETKEAARTYGNGSKSGRGLRKGITPNRNLTFEGADSSELQILREKNEEYRKALNVFRNKLNEVAVFNSSGGKITYTYPNILREKLKDKGVTIDVLALGGKTTDWMKKNLPAKLKAKKYDRVIIHGGGNDTSNASIPLTTTINNIQQMVGLASSTGAGPYNWRSSTNSSRSFASPTTMRVCGWSTTHGLFLSAWGTTFPLYSSSFITAAERPNVNAPAGFRMSATIFASG